MGNDIELRNPGRAGAHPYRRLAKSDPLAVGLFFFAFFAPFRGYSFDTRSAVASCQIPGLVWLFTWLPLI